MEQEAVACRGKYTSEQMAAFRLDGDHTWYYDCQRIEDYKPGAYQVVSDQPIATLYKGAMEAAILGGGVGAGLAMSGDTITQRGGSTSAVSGSSAIGNIHQGKSHRGRR